MVVPMGCGSNSNYVFCHTFWMGVMSTYTEACEKLYMDNIILKDAILEALDKLKGHTTREPIYKDLKEALEKTYEQ